MTITIQLTKEEKIFAEDYAKRNNQTLEEAFKEALFDKIEDEYDSILANEAYASFIQSGKSTRPIDELWHDLDLL